MVARVVMSQLLDAERQHSLGSSELLVALLLEGVVPTLGNAPFVEWAPFNPEPTLMALRSSRFPSVSESQCQAALAARKRLRHRNAHPEWLTADQRLATPAITQSFEDMSSLSWLYGRIILEASGVQALADRIRLDSDGG